MKLLERQPPILVWIIGITIGVLVGAFLPRSILFMTAEEVAEHRHDDEGGESWACPMLCVVLDAPGTCPVCGMDLEPFASTGTEVVLSRHDQEMIGLSVAEATERDLYTSFTATGRIEFDETDTYTVTAWTGGRIERLYVSFEGDQVSRGSVLLDIYSPELYAAQQELLILSDDALLLGEQGIEAAWEKLRLLGVSNAQIERVLQAGEPNSMFTVVSPTAGTVTSVHVTEGEYLTRGQVLFQVADLSRVWLVAYLPEDEAGMVESGQTASFSLDSAPGLEFSGTVDTVVPFLNRPGGAAEARIPLDNGSGNLLPGQTAAVTFTGANEDRILSVPRSSVLRLGQRSLVYVLTAPTVYSTGDDGSLLIEEARFSSREIVTGPLSHDGEGNQFYPVHSGVEWGEVVALEGAFLIDSQAELVGLPSLLNPDGRR